MDHDAAIHAAHSMQDTGGGFAAALAQAFFRADSSNRSQASKGASTMLLVNATASTAPR